MNGTHRRWALVTAGVVAGAAVVGGVAVAAIPDTATGTITACVDAATGAIRVIDPGAATARIEEPLPTDRCIDTETELTWQSGGLRFRSGWEPTVTYRRDDIVTRNGTTYIATGSSTGQDPADVSRASSVWATLATAGATGPIGPTGPRGPQGATGATGATGAPGPLGETGPAGPAGTDGQDGADGVDGAPGAKGDTGPQGPVGDQGPDGTDGQDGTDGTNGAPGAKGDTGPKGPTGDTGPDGTDGAQGDTGPQGPTGAAGPDGWPIRTQTDTVVAQGAQPSMTIGDDGLPIISHRTPDGNLAVTHCDNPECTTSTTTTVDDDPTADVGAGSSITIGDDGNPVIAYSTSVRETRIALCADATCDGPATIRMVHDDTSHFGTPAGTSIAIGSDGNPITAFNSANSLFIAHCSEATCADFDVNSHSGWIPRTIDRSDTTLSIAIAPDGRPRIVFMDGGYYFVVFVTCTDLVCSSLGGTFLLDDVAIGAAVATIGADGLPVIVHSDFTGSTLIHCGDVACGGEATIVFDDESADAEVAVGVDALPVIGYVNSGDLRVTRCQDVQCSTVSTTNVVTAAMTGYSATAVATVIGADGLPVIAYTSSTGDIRVVACGNLACSPSFQVGRP